MASDAKWTPAPWLNAKSWNGSICTQETSATPVTICFLTPDRYFDRRPLLRHRARNSCEDRRGSPCLTAASSTATAARPANAALTAVGAPGAAFSGG